jgi:hypothetical protein
MSILKDRWFMMLLIVIGGTLLGVIILGILVSLGIT